MAIPRSAVLSVLLALGLASPLAAATVATAAPAAGRSTAAAAGGSSTAAPAGFATAATVATTGFHWVDITARDGADLKANVIAPATPGLHPAVVFVNSWGLNDNEYLAQAYAFASHGYVALSYTTRGFWGSGGQIETAGPKDIDDVSAAIDWLLANTSADPARIGACGASYGSGIALIASAFEPRIKAVVAMSTWADMVASLYGDHTRRPQAVDLLSIASQLFGHPSAELTAMLAAYNANQNLDPVVAWGKIRSAATYLDAINRNRPAIMMANSYGDSLFPPNQLVDFFGDLAGPKRLELAPGDHVVVEGTGLIGLPNHVWDSAYRWFDRYLSGIRNGIDAEKPVVLRRLDSNAVEQYQDWAHVTSSTKRLYLGGASGFGATGAMSPTAGTGSWSETITSGHDTTAGAGVALLTGAFTALTGVPPLDWLPSVNRDNGSVWESGTLPGGAAIRGMPKLHLGVTAPQGKGTVVGYLYDVDVTDTGRLITNAPVTWLSPANTIDVTFPATAYNVPAGHRLALVVDTVDPLYLGANQNNATISFTDGSYLDVPLK